MPKKKIVKKAPVKKPAAKATKPVVKKAVPKVAVKKAVAKKPQNTAVKKTEKASAKKPIASVVKSDVKTSSTAKDKPSRIIPIKAPTIVLAKPKTFTTKSEMNLPIVPPNYEPQDKEEFMNPVMREYFRKRLVEWRDELLRESGETLHVLQEEGNMQKPDITDRASEETDLAIEFRVRDRERKLLNKINEALSRIEDNSYGYCEETGDPIPLKRLIAYPTVNMTVEARELHERRERTQRDQFE